MQSYVFSCEEERHAVSSYQSSIPPALLIKRARNAKASMLESWQASEDQRSFNPDIYRTIHCPSLTVLQAGQKRLCTLLLPHIDLSHTTAAAITA